MATQILDTKGLNCPMPVLKAKKAIKALNTGDTIEILGTDPGSVKDFEAFCGATGHKLLESENVGDGVYRFVIEKN